MNNKTSIVTLIVVAIIAICVPPVLGKAPVINVSPTPVTVNVPEQKTPVVNVEAPVVNVPETKFGGFQSPENYVHQYFYAGLTRGGNYATTSAVTMSAYTTRAADFAGLPTTIQWTNNLNVTVTLSSTSTLGYIPKIGDTVDVYFLNASSTAGATITFAAADANLDLQFAEATGGDLVLNGLDWAKLTFIRTSAYKVAVIFDEMTEAD
jgi:hypothetical protein